MTSSSSSSSAITVSDNGRLPAIVIPHHYKLCYRRIDLEPPFHFEGQVTIDITSLSTAPPSDCASSLVLHTRDLQLTSATLTSCSSNEASVASTSTSTSWTAVEFRYQLHHQTCHILFDSSSTIWTPHTHYQLCIDFVGSLNDQMAGLYRSSYTNLQGRQVTMATTQFEPTDARRAFPCFDEPALKATFQVSVELPAASSSSSLQAISNTPIVASHTTCSPVTQQLIQHVTFATTPKMSTYLLALVIGEFDAIAVESPTTKIQTTVYTVPGKAAQGQFCLDTASRCLDFLQEIYGVPYPLSKSDLLAIPDFAAGAMENWGCVTYREAKILVTDQSSESVRRGIARTVCHELAHQWFGNLVTPEFWTQLWLKEGVARFMEFVALDHLFPAWNAWDEFVQSVYNLALSLDSLESSHPVEVQVTHSDEINEIFDAISYAKGASIIRMLSNYIGFDCFMKGVRLYLTRHAYGNAVSEDFWNALAEVSGKPCVEFMKKWTNVIGFPILQLKQYDNNNNNKLIMSTDRFCASGANTIGAGAENNAENDATHWPIPVTARVEGIDEIQGPWVVHGPEKDESAALLDQIEAWSSAGKWFKLNVDQYSFYRVNYTPQQWERLSVAMDPVAGPLSATDRLGLISDSFAAGKAGYASIVDSIRLVQGFANHDTAEYVVWQELSSNLSSLASLYRSEAFYPKFQEMLGKLYTRQYHLLGWEASPTESARTGTLRGTILSMMGVAKDPAVLQEGYRRFMDLTKAGSLEGQVSGDIQGVLFRLALRHDETTVFRALQKIYEEQDSLSPETQRDCLVVMGCVQGSKLQVEMLDYIFFSGKVRQQDMAFPLSSLSAACDEGGRATWSYFKKNFDRLHAKLGSGFLWRDCVGLSSRGLRTAAEAQEVEDFFREPGHSPGSGARRLQQALEVVRTQAARLERDRQALTSYFDG